MSKVSDKGVDKITTRVLCSITFFFVLEIRKVYQVKWKNVVESDMSQMTT